MRRFAMLGISTSEIEVSLASNRGFWLLLGDEELFVPYSEFPWFKKATIEEISKIEWPNSAISVRLRPFIDSVRPNSW
jgi:hypothetical protein